MSDIALPITGVPSRPRARRLLSDERLAKLAGRGDARAFAALYERNHQAIYRYCRSIVRHDQDAQDALQNTMMRAYAALRADERDLAVRPWLFRIAHNESISILRRRRDSAELDERQEHPSGAVDGTVESRERFSTLVSDLRSLPERQRGALLMRELSGLSVEEIAQALSISQGAAKQTIFEARNSLHELAEGRDMRCEAVREAISARDGRVLRARRMRAHLCACADCRSFDEAIGTRRADLHALAPALPAPAAGALLARLLAHGAGHSGGASVAGASFGGQLGGQGGLLGGQGASLGAHATSSLFVKGLAGIAIAAAAAAGTAHLAAQHHGAHGSPGQADSTKALSARPSYRSSSGLAADTVGKLSQSHSVRSTASPGFGASAPATDSGGHISASIFGTVPSPAAGPNGSVQGHSNVTGHARGNAHIHTNGTGSDQPGGRGHDRHHSSSHRGPSATGRAHHQSRAHGTSPGRPSGEPRHEGHSEAEHDSSASGSPAREPATPATGAGEASRHSTGANEGHTAQSPQNAGGQGTGRPEEARHTTPSSRSAT